jgi:hypothetical protein
MVHDGFPLARHAGVWVKVLEGHLHNLVLLANVAGARDRKSRHRTLAVYYQVSPQHHIVVYLTFAIPYLVRHI